MKQLKVLFSIYLISFFLLDVNAQSRRVTKIGITVSEMDRAVEFYSNVLQFKKLTDKEVWGTDWENLVGLFGVRIRVVTMQLGDEQIELIDYLTAGGRKIPEDQKSNDISFQHIAIVVSDMDSAYKLLKRFNITHVSTSPQTLPASNIAAAGIKAFYFRDPDGHNLELIYFPKGKGDEKWQRNKGKIFLGIDHSAIAVSKTEASHNFYRDLLGLEKKGESWNNGTEQAHLNNVENASLHITGYRAEAGIGVEFLEYLNINKGKKYPADTRADDLWSWYIKIQVSNLPALIQKLKNHSSKIISRKIAGLSPKELMNTVSVMVRDPDGHALLLTEINE